MHRTRLVLSGTAIAAMIAMAGCDPQPNSAAPAATAAPAASSIASAAPAAEATEAAADDAATAKACKDMRKHIKDNAARIAKAEKIGPPAGHYAVSAQWAAGSAAVIAHSIGASGAVETAAGQVQKEMMDLSDAYNESADAKPSKKKLDAAVKDLDAACG